MRVARGAAPLDIGDRSRRTPCSGERLVVAIDGPSGSGKSTVARGRRQRARAALPRHRRDVPRDDLAGAAPRRRPSTTPARSPTLGEPRDLRSAPTRRPDDHRRRHRRGDGDPHPRGHRRRQRRQRGARGARPPARPAAGDHRRRRDRGRGPRHRLDGGPRRRGEGLPDRRRGRPAQRRAAEDGAGAGRVAATEAALARRDRIDSHPHRLAAAPGRRMRRPVDTTPLTLDEVVDLLARARRAVPADEPRPPSTRRRESIPLLSVARRVASRWLIGSSTRLRVTAPRTCRRRAR